MSFILDGIKSLIYADGDQYSHYQKRQSEFHRITQLHHSTMYRLDRSETCNDDSIQELNALAEKIDTFVLNVDLLQKGTVLEREPVKMLETRKWLHDLDNIKKEVWARIETIITAQTIARVQKVVGEPVTYAQSIQIEKVCLESKISHDLKIIEIFFRVQANEIQEMMDLKKAEFLSAEEYKVQQAKPKPEEDARKNAIARLRELGMVENNISDKEIDESYIRMMIDSLKEEERTKLRDSAKKEAEKFYKEILAPAGYKLDQVPDDGNCLFCVLAKERYPDIELEVGMPIVRQEIADFIRSKDFDKFVQTLNLGDLSFEDIIGMSKERYAQLTEKPANKSIGTEGWGEDTHAKIAGFLYKTPIQFFTVTDFKAGTFGTESKDDLPLPSESFRYNGTHSKERPIQIFLHGSNHWNRLYTS